MATELSEILRQRRTAFEDGAQICQSTVSLPAADADALPAKPSGPGESKSKAVGAGARRGTAEAPTISGHSQGAGCGDLSEVLSRRRLVVDEEGEKFESQFPQEKNEIDKNVVSSLISGAAAQDNQHSRGGMNRDFNDVLHRRRLVVDKEGENFESKPEESTTDQSHDDKKLLPGALGLAAAAGESSEQQLPKAVPEVADLKVQGWMQNMVQPRVKASLVAVVPLLALLVFAWVTA